MPTPTKPRWKPSTSPTSIRSKRCCKQWPSGSKADPKSDPGTVVNIIGMGGKIASDIHIAGGAANAALMLATVGLAHYYAKLGIRINAINPGATLTERVEESLALEAQRQGIDTRRSAGAQPGESAARPLRQTGGNRERCIVPGEPPGELRVRRNHSDGRRWRR